MIAPSHVNSFSPLSFLGISIDVKRNVVSPFSKTGTTNDTIEWMIASGGIGSTEENLINEQVHQVASVSTIEVLTLASQAGIPVYVITSDNASQILPLLQIDPSIVQFIAQSVSRGLFVIVPQTNVTLNQWTGTGFIVVDPNSGAAGYLLAGGIGGQIVVSNGGATSTSTPQLLGDTSLDPTIQSSLDNQEQTSLDANAKTTKQPPNSAAVQLKKSEANNDFIFAPFAIIPGVFLVASKNPITVVFGGVLVFGGFVVVGMGIGKLIDANQETK